MIDTLGFTGASSELFLGYFWGSLGCSLLLGDSCAACGFVVCLELSCESPGPLAASCACHGLPWRSLVTILHVS
jgi:hypothetical protein